jgi:hypothetical protein
VNLDNIRALLTQPTLDSPFLLLQHISRLLATESQEVAQELVLRALDRDEDFAAYRPVLDALVRELGLFPYLQPDTLSTADQLAYEFHRPYNMGQSIVFHRPQAEVYRRLLNGENVILSAPTSFGKSLVIDAVIATGRFHNILIVVPTIALIDETRRRLARRFRGEYHIITHPFQRHGERNIRILTQERVLEYDSVDGIDFFVIDEFYKLSPGRDDDARCARLNEAFYRLSKTNAQFYLLGPNILGVRPELRTRLSYHFMHEPYQTVVSQLNDKTGSQRTELQRLIALCRDLTESTLIFCKSPSRAAEVTKALLSAGVGRPGVAENLAAAEWAGRHYHPEWHCAQALGNGVGVHHGRVPRALAQYIVRSFNEDRLSFLVCTSTLIEGVNTKAKNVIVFDDSINREAIDLFTFNNIRGRSGRMGHHVIGNVYLFHPPPDTGLPFIDVPAFTQPEDMDSGLLLQLDEQDLTDRSRDKLAQFANQRNITLATLRANVGIEPESQIALANELASNPSHWHQLLGWRGIPTARQVEGCTNLFWKHFRCSKLGSGSARTPKQLTYLINRLRAKPSTRQLIVEQYKYSKDWDAAVQQCLDFLRLWAGFHYPRILRALDNIQREVFARAGLRPGNYDLFASQVEYCFFDPALAALDDYGVPIELARRIEHHVLVTGDLDHTLERFRDLIIDSLGGLSSFERKLLREAQEGL